MCPFTCQAAVFSVTYCSCASQIHLDVNKPAALNWDTQETLEGFLSYQNALRNSTGI